MASIKERQANKAASINLDDDEPQRQTGTRNEPRTAPGQLMNLQGKYAQALDENLNLLRRLEESSPSELRIDQLHEKAGRRRKLTGEQFGELVANLRSNPLVTPVTVRRREEGGYEIVSGHNRVQAFRELGRERILAAVIDADDNQAELNAFYANLLQPDLPDFEKFIGFRDIELRHPNLTRTEIASNAGVAKSTISQLMSFSGLPEEVLAILHGRPEVLGANAAQALAKIAAAGKGDSVIQAVRKLAAGEVDQAQAIRLAKASIIQKAASKGGEPVRIKAGKRTYCDLLRADKVLRLVFNSPEEAQEAQELVRRVLQDRAMQILSKN